MLRRSHPIGPDPLGPDLIPSDPIPAAMEQDEASVLLPERGLSRLPRFKAYRRRWFLLGVVCLLNCSNAMVSPAAQGKKGGRLRGSGSVCVALPEGWGRSGAGRTEISGRAGGLPWLWPPGGHGVRAGSTAFNKLEAQIAAWHAVGGYQIIY